MINRIPFVIFLISASLPLLAAAPMRQVLEVVDSATLRLDGGETVRLAGVVPAEPVVPASQILRSMLAGRWVLIEREPHGGVYAFRSPDVLFVNAELIRLGLALGSPSALQHGADLAEAESEARFSHVGIWSETSDFHHYRTEMHYLGQLLPEARQRSAKLALRMPVTPRAAKEAKTAKGPKKSPRAVAQWPVIEITQ